MGYFTYVGFEEFVTLHETYVRDPDLFKNVDQTSRYRRLSKDRRDLELHQYNIGIYALDV